MALIRPHLVTRLPPARPPSHGSRRVVVWRAEWLRPSETFVRHHVDSLRRWTPVPLAAVAVPSALTTPRDQHLFGTGALESLRYDAFRALRVSGRLRRSLRRSGAAVVHAHFGTDAVRVAPTCRLLGLPLVVTLHGRDVTSEAVLGGVRGRLYRRRLRRTLRQAAAVVAVSQHIADRAVALGADPAVVRVHHSGIPLDPRPAQAWPPPREPEWDVLLVGRLVEKKGALDLVRALALLREDVRPLRTAIIGSGPLEAQVRDAARREGLDVQLLGTLAPAEVAAAMEACAVVAVPSRTARDGDAEGLPTVVLEAAAHRRPVVAYRHSGIPEAVVHGETGLLSDEGDTGDLARNLAVLLRDPSLRARLGAAARARVERDFDVDRQARALEALYDRVARGGHRGAGDAGSGDAGSGDAGSGDAEELGDRDRGQAA